MEFLLSWCYHRANYARYAFNAFLNASSPKRTHLEHIETQSYELPNHCLGNCSLFAEKGFKQVTMKDICDAAKLSRGGLYCHYESTRQIFQEMIDDMTSEQDNITMSAAFH